MKLFRNQPFLRLIVAYVILSHIFQLCFPIQGYALTSGPSTPEVSGFSPIGATNRVNLFTGDYSENIPLLDIEGYPLNISYSSGITMDQEASCVGLGWSINPGNIYRSMRGLPDDFKGDQVKREFNIRPNTTFGVNASLGFELFGKDMKKSLGRIMSWLRGRQPTLTPSFGISYNNYTGYGLDVGVKPTFKLAELNGTTMTGGLGFSASSSSGLSLKPSLAFSRKIARKQKGEKIDQSLSLLVASNINSRGGLQALSFDFTGKNEYLSQKSKDSDESHPTRGFNGGSAITFAVPTYSPQINFPFKNSSYTFYLNGGVELFGAEPNLSIQGYYSRQKLAYNEESNASYGYLYLEETSRRNDVVLDFNREKDGPFMKNVTTNLPLTNLTYDTYMASGQGVSGMFRPHRNSPGVVYDKRVVNTAHSIILGGELGALNLAHLGGNFGGSWTNSHSGRWTGQDKLSNKFKFRGKNNSDPTYESVYFKNAGEKTANSDLTYYGKIGNEDAVRPMLSNRRRSRPRVENGFESEDGHIYTSSSYTRANRDKRNQVFSWLNAADAKEVGLEKSIYTYKENTGYGNSNPLAIDTIERVDFLRKAHHMSQIEVARPDGMRYFYGFPTYNLVQKEVAFNVSGQPSDCTNGLVDYDKGDDNSLANERGEDHYYNSTETPGYAYSYLLTSIVSDNYVDHDTIEGPSDGDLGSWHKINYSRTDSAYRWRTPFQKDKANYNEGFKTHHLDDKANYVYGEKEITYVHSIESRHYIALFSYSYRNDGYGVKGENGGLDTNEKLRKLETITLYSKKDLKENPLTAFPIKTVHFEYDYSLCKGIPNNIHYGNASKPANEKGKLTLKKLYFTYGNSEQAALSPYEFHYAEPNFDGQEDATLNPDYDLKGYDRWGNYKPNDGCANNNLPNPEFPYVDQKPVSSNDPTYRPGDDYAQAWLLSWMKLPSGGLLKISYESDDYAYVQHKTAMQMVKVLGVGNSPTATPGNHLINPSSQENNNYIFLDLPIGVSSSQEFKDYYLRGLDDTTWYYFNFFTRITPKVDEYEYVPGFVQIKNAGVVPGNSNMGWLEVKTVGIRDNGRGDQVQPMAKASWNFVRMNLPWKVFKGQAPRGTGESAIRGMLGFGRDFRTFFQGFNRTLLKDKYGISFNPAKSWMRLTTPDGMKHGGGVRVTKIELDDRWDEMSGGEKRDYGQQFEYTTKDCDGRTISSGVAAYEPVLGGEENPFRRPRFMVKRNLLAADNEYFQMFPYGEFAYPAPSVGYSTVRVSSLTHQDVTRNSTGYVENKFYTARDYPTITDETLPPDAKPKGPSLGRIIGWNREHMTVSQGYVIKRNDMHGKPRSTKTYATGKPGAITGVEYYYRNKRAYMPCASLKSMYSVPNELDNEGIPLIFPDGSHGTGTVGVDIEMVTDLREHESTTSGFMPQGNLDAFFAFILPLAFPSLWFSVTREQTRFRSAVATKVVDTYGILERTVAIDNGARVETRNLAYDAETGEVLVTQTDNEYKDDLFSLAQPAHWAYSGMGSAYQNIGLEINTPQTLNGFTQADEWFHPGDELLLEKPSGAIEKGWVLDVPSSTTVTLVKQSGTNYSSSTTFNRIQIIRSGRRNLQALSIGSISSKQNPLSYASQNVGDLDDKIIGAGAVEYSDHWQTYCGDDICGCPTLGNNCIGQTVNPYFEGIKGNWRPLRSHAYLTERTAQNPVSIAETDIRNKGLYSQFHRFWRPSLPGAYWQPFYTNWTWASEVALISPYGQELENKDALNRYSSALFGYGHQLPIAIAGNARLHEIANVNFEVTEDAQLFCHTHAGFTYVVQGGGSYFPGMEKNAHSGYRSHPVFAYGSYLQGVFDITQPGSFTPGGISSNQYTIGEGDCVRKFSPTAGKRYVLSVWVRSDLYDQTGDPMFEYGDADVEIYIDGTQVPKGNFDSEKRSKIIQGWQQIEIIFEIPATAQNEIEIRLLNSNNNDDTYCYYDDFRMYPFDASMQTHVYDPVTQRLLASGDANNYMMFYSYNQEGKLIGTKVETNRGIKSLNEARYHSTQH